MKKLGFIFLVLGVAILGFLLLSFMKPSDQLISPVIDNSGVRVIYVTPTI